MPAAVEGKHIGQPPAQRRGHRQRWDEGMVALNMDKVGIARENAAVDVWRNVVVALSRPCRHAGHIYLPYRLLRRKSANAICGEHADAETLLNQAAAGLVDVGLNAAHFREEALCHHQDLQRWHAQALGSGSCQGVAWRSKASERLRALHA